MSLSSRPESGYINAKEGLDKFTVVDEMRLFLLMGFALMGCESYMMSSDIKKEMTGWLPFEYHQYTIALHGMHDPKTYHYHPVVNPIYTTSTYQQKEPGKDYGYVYSRIGNPTRESLERVIAKLDYAKYANVFPSGMSAIYAILGLLTPDDHIVCSEDVFDGTYKYVHEHTDIEFQSTFVNPTVEEFVGAIRKNTKMIWVESPSNPILKVTDIPKLAEAVRRVKQDIIVVMDNTFLGPFFQKGLKLGADVVVYSVSKYLNGHSDVIMGAAVTNHKTIHDYLTGKQRYSGLIPSPFDCSQVLRGIKTHPVRMLQHWKNALRIAKWLEVNPYVETVHYPGLRRQSALPRKMWSGMSGMLSFKLRNFSYNMTRDFLGQLRHFRVAWSLGTVESLAEQPYVMLDTSFPEAVRRKLGVTPNLVRLSVGLEYYEDLIEDLDQALKTIAPEGAPFEPRDTTDDPFPISHYRPNRKEYVTEDPFNISHYRPNRKEYATEDPFNISHYRPNRKEYATEDPFEIPHHRPNRKEYATEDPFNISHYRPNRKEYATEDPFDISHHRPNRKEHATEDPFDIPGSYRKQKTRYNKRGSNKKHKPYEYQKLSKYNPTSWRANTTMRGSQTSKATP